LTSDNLPPHEGPWLAHSSKPDAGLSWIEHFSSLPREEFDEIQLAYDYFNRHAFIEEVRPIRKAQRDWNNALDFAPRTSRLGPFKNEIVEDALVNFLNCWRKAIDNLGHQVSRRFQKSSTQYSVFKEAKGMAFDAHFGYRVVESLRNMNQHMESPPLRQSLKRHPYSCNECGQMHEEDPVLSVTLSCEWIKSGCQGFLKRELASSDFENIDVAAVIKESMYGFDDVLRALLFSAQDASVHKENLLGAFEKANPYYPALFDYWLGEDREPHGSLQPLNATRWIVDPERRIANRS